MKQLLLALMLYFLCSGQVTVAAMTYWRPMASNMQTEYVLRYMEAAEVHHWARMRYAARAATAYCKYKNREQLPYGG